MIDTPRVPANEAASIVGRPVPPIAARAYFLRKLAAGKTRMEALRCLKRRLSDVVYRHLAADATTLARDPDEQMGASPGGHFGATLQSSAVDSHPNIDTSDQPLPGPAATTLPATAATRKIPNERRLEPAH